MKHIVKFYDGLSPLKRIVITAIPSAAIFYFAAFLSTWIAQLWQGADWKWKVAIHGLWFIFLSTIAIALVRVFETTRDELQRARDLQKEQLRRQKEVERDALASAHAHCDRVVGELISHVDNEYGSPAGFIEHFSVSLRTIQDYVKAAYLTFEDKFSNGSDPMERINFEFTFMTQSYEDGEITIPACANRENRAPRSMVLRKKDKTKYKSTETAKIYAADRPEPIIIEDTHQSKGYASLYDGELNRIRSSIIYPILSDKNELLGTLVVHCDRPNFFTLDRRKYWFELLEIFTKKIAFEKRKLDVLSTISPRDLRLQFPIPKMF